MNPSPILLKAILLLGSINLILTYPGKLTFTPEGKFTILQLTDLHYGTDEINKNNTRFQDTFIGKVKPDMVAATGDIASGYEYTDQVDFTKNIWKQFWISIEKYKIPYLFAMGNHDAEGDIDEKAIYELEKLSQYSLCAGAKQSSYDDFNYYIPIYSSTDKDKVAVIMWVFNSHSHGCLEDATSWGCVGLKEIEWYKKKYQELKRLLGDDVYHLGIVHIPPPEFMKLRNEYAIYGTAGEFVACPSVDSHFFEAIKEGGIQAIYSGHDHWNDYGGVIDGVEFVYGRKSGYGGYGSNDPVTRRGARVIMLRESKDENGKIKIEREHNVLIESPGLDDVVEDNSLQKQLKKGEVKEQKECYRSYIPPGGFPGNNGFNTVLLSAVLVIALGIFGVAFWIVYKRRSMKQKVKHVNLEDESQNSEI